MTIFEGPGGTVAGPRIERVRHEARVRRLRVIEREYLTPGMLRVTLGGDDLAGFTSLGFDDHVKLMVPVAGGEVARRDYTPRRYDAQAGTLAIDFAVHDAGPATAWALGCRPGDTIDVGGPRGSKVIASDVRRWLLIGDETALPAIGRHVEEAGTGVRVTSVVAIAGPDEEQAFETAADHEAVWAHRPVADAGDPAALLAAVRTVRLEPETFVWIAAEAGVARALRDHLSHHREWIKAGGYWARGRADTHETIE